MLTPEVQVEGHLPRASAASVGHGNEKTTMGDDQARNEAFTCDCSVGHRKEKAIMGDVITARHEMKPDTIESSKIPISA